MNVRQAKFLDVINEVSIGSEYGDESGSRGGRQKLNAVGGRQLAKPQALLPIVVLSIGDVAAVRGKRCRISLPGSGDSLHADGGEIHTVPLARQEINDGNDKDCKN